MCMMSSLSYRPHIYSHQVWLTDAGRLILRPIPCSLTCTSAVSHQVVACITTVDSCLFKCCSIGMTNLAVGSVIQRTTVHSCRIYIYCIANVLLSELTGLQVLHGVWAHLTEHLSQTMLILSLHFEVLNNNTPSHVGSLPDHTPPGWHVRVLFPTRLYPVLQL